MVPQNMDDFNPSGVGMTNGNIFGLPFGIEESKLVFIPVPWDVTVSHREGTCLAPGEILAQSAQIDLFDPFAVNAWRCGMAMEAIDRDILSRNKSLREQAIPYIQFLEQGGNPAHNQDMMRIAATINEACEALHRVIESKCKGYIGQGQLPFLVGGDHSLSYGMIKAHAAAFPGIGILQIDAHADLRDQYQGFIHSHASVMRNAMQLEDVSVLVQVGIREWCDQEQEYMDMHRERIISWFDRDLHAAIYRGKSWHQLCKKMIKPLPQYVYVSFDIDGLAPAFAPNTGTPVPGGLSFNQACYLLEQLTESGRTIVGADLVETGADAFDAMIACRLLYKIAGMMLKGVCP